MIAVRNENSRYIYIPMDDTGSTEQKGVWLVVVVGVVPLFFLGYCTYIGRPFLHSSDCFHILKFDRELFLCRRACVTECTFYTMRLIEIYKSTF